MKPGLQAGCTELSRMLVLCLTPCMFSSPPPGAPTFHTGDEERVIAGTNEASLKSTGRAGREDHRQADIHAQGRSYYLLLDRKGSSWVGWNAVDTSRVVCGSCVAFLPFEPTGFVNTGLARHMSVVGVGRDPGPNVRRPGLGWPPMSYGILTF